MSGDPILSQFDQTIPRAPSQQKKPAGISKVSQGAMLTSFHYPSALNTGGIPRTVQSLEPETRDYHVTLGGRPFF
jgi:hypothetical protein